jgi:indolepyruvate ferredoxin oxidoreductase alpha subunit
VIGIIGDSTFVHSGIPPLIDAVYNNSHLSLVILDNTATGMTGAQPHAASGKNARGEDAPRLDLAKMVEATGVRDVTVVDTWQRKDVFRALNHALASDGPSVVIAQGPCQQLPEMKRREIIPFIITEELCTQCDACFKVYCPAIIRTEQNYPRIVANECVSCTVCAQVCPTDAIHLVNVAVAVEEV